MLRNQLNSLKVAKTKSKDENLVGRSNDGGVAVVDGKEATFEELGVGGGRSC